MQMLLHHLVCSSICMNLEAVSLLNKNLQVLKLFA
jgi:hypothetical protein